MNEGEGILLLAGLMYRPDLLKNLLKGFGSLQIFDNSEAPCCAYIWSVIRDIYISLKEPPNKATLEIELHNRIEYLKARKPVRATNISKVFSKIKSFRKNDIQEPLIKKLYDSVVTRAGQSELKDKLGSFRTSEDLSQFTQNLSNRMKYRGKYKIRICKPLAEMRKNLVRVQKFEFGVRYLDELSGGGGVPGNLIGYLGPSGGGKTVNAVNILVAQAMRKRNSVMVSYEQEMEGNLSERIATRFTERNIITYQNVGFFNLDKKLQTELDKATKEFNKYCNVLPFNEDIKDDEGNVIHKMGVGGVSELEEGVLAIEEETGEKVEYLVVDWLGAMVTRFMTDKGMDASKNYGHVAETFMDDLKKLAVSRKLIVVVFHQLTNEAAAKPPTYKPNATESYRFRAFQHKADMIFVQGTLRQDNKVGWLVNGKNRVFTVGDKLIKLHGIEQYFEDVGDSYTTDYKGNFIEKETDIPDYEEAVNSVERKEKQKEVYDF